MSEQLGLTVKKDENFSEWYTQVVLKAELADYSSVKGCMVIRPLGYALWENIQRTLDKKFKETGVKNVYFPLFIPESLLKKEAEHFEGFVPEVGWITHSGDKPLEERLAVRPTSETVMYDTFSKWIRSYRDLPLRVNQWCSVSRFETKATRLFLRTREFLWQEGHTVHVMKEEADKEMILRLKQYRELIESYLAIPVLIGKKSEKEKFAGALTTTTLEAMMPDGKALQMGTSHNLGQHFSQVFDIKFLDKDKKEKHAWQTSWGLSTRTIGALVMAHGDDRGLVLPPMITPIHVVIIPIGFEKDKKILDKAKDVKAKLEKAGYSVEMDDREEHTPGWKFNDWELKGIPVRIEIGPKDLKAKQVTLVRRDTLKKTTAKEKDVVNIVKKLLDDIQNYLLNKARKFLKDNTTNVKTYNEFKKVLEEKGGFIRTSWCGHTDCEEKIKEDTTATVRIIPFEKEKIDKKCFHCNRDAINIAYFAKAY